MIKSTADLANIKSLAVQSIEKWIGVDRIYVNNYIELLYIILRVAASVLMIGIGPIAWFIRAKKKGKLNNKSIFFIIFLGVNLTEIVLIFMFSKAYTAGHHVRYFTNSFLLLCCVSSEWLYEIIHSIKRVYLSSLLVFISVLTASLQLVSPYDDYLRQFETKTELVRYLEDNNLNYGYSSYWYSGVNSAISNESVRINSLILNGREIEPFLFLNYKGWYAPQRYEGSTFLILDESEFSNDYWREFAFNLCGEPSKVIMFQDLYILTYDYNISSVLCYS
ncbi:MAG: hypothetical protein K6F79_00225 [Saccharofermentans sp.]|nr:hypothetical protein [Saccharofermentans sp.]